METRRKSKWQGWSSNASPCLRLIYLAWTRNPLERAFPPPATTSMNDMPGRTSRHRRFDRRVIHEGIVDFCRTRGTEGDAMETFLGAEVLPFDRDFLAGFGLIPARPYEFSAACCGHIQGRARAFPHRSL